MPSDDFNDVLTKLEQDYQILTELHRADDSRTYLARHLKLNRDVTVTVIRGGAGGGETKSLSRFAGDVARLKSARHPTVIPVIEGRWLADGVFAVVRARVRGSNLDQLVDAEGSIPLPRVASTLEEVRGAIEWARNNGIANRRVAHDALIFQQGSGRVLLSFEPSALASGTAIDTRDDARTIGLLAWEMLAGAPYDVAGKSLAELRPDLSPAIVSETEGLIHSERSAPRDVGAYIAMLGGNSAMRIPAASALPIPARAGFSGPTPVYTGPVGSTKDAVVVVKHGWSFGARFGTAVAVLAVIAIVAFLFMQRRESPAVDRTADNSSAQSPQQAAGDVASPSARPDTTAVASAPVVQPTIVPPTTTLPRVAQSPMTQSGMMQRPGAADSVRPRIAPPVTRRHEPPRSEIPAVRLSNPPAAGDSSDAAVATTNTAARNTDPAGVCSSPTGADQQRCLMNAIDKNDVDLNSSYSKLIAALRRQANVTSDDPDPDPVGRLRSAQRRWLDDRDQTCHTVGSGPLYARDRARCFADQSAKRTRELRDQLDALPPP